MSNILKINKRKKTSGFIFNLKKYAVHDGPGIRLTIFFQGCPMKCLWCHNPESLELPENITKNLDYRNCLRPFSGVIPDIIAREVNVSEIMREIEKDVIFYDQSGGGVTFSGGEPLLQPEFLKSLLVRCQQKGIHTAVDTTGYVSWQVLEDLSKFVDLYLYDLKMMDDDLHRKFTGVSNAKILRNLNKLLTEKKDVTVRIPLIPEITDTKQNLTAIARYLKKFPTINNIDLLPFNKMGEKKYNKLERSYSLGKLKHQSEQALNQMKAVFTSLGFSVNIGG
jgi:pyruvate formate lyase activating enzyme